MMGVVRDLATVAVSLLLYPLVWRALGIAYEPARMFHERGDLLGAELERDLARLDARWKSRWVLPVGVTALSFAAYPWWRWPALDPTGTLRWLVVLLGALVTWKSVTMDIDLGEPHPRVAARYRERALLLAALAGVWLYPGCVCLWLFIAINGLRAWQHHNHALLRPLFFLVGALPAAIFQPVTAPLLFLVITVTASQYFVSGVRKLRVGRRPWSWAWHNRLSNLFVGSYLWGWCRFRSEASTIRLARLLRRVERPAQIFVVAFELGTLFVLVDRRLADALLGSALAFHVMTLVLGGIFFWQNMALLAALLVAVHRLPPAVAAELFGPAPGALAAALMLLFPLRKRLWKPTHLGWWDTPLVCRVDWIVHGESGRRYGLYNDFLNPNDRLFGNKIGFELSRHPRITHHTGECEHEQVARALYAGDDVASIQRRFGAVEFHPARARAQIAYVVAVLRGVQQGRRKHVVPVWMRAPGDQLFYWGLAPRFTGQERVTRLELVEREYLFEGQRIVTTRETTIVDVDLSSAS
jgi:hypothetical protein